MFKMYASSLCLLHSLTAAETIYSHSQQLHLVSLSPSIRTPLELHNLRVQSHDLVIQMAHFCHLQNAPTNNSFYSQKYKLKQRFSTCYYLCKGSSSFFIFLPGFQHLFRSFKQIVDTYQCIGFCCVAGIKTFQLPSNTHISHSASGRCISLGHTGCYS